MPVHHGRHYSVTLHIDDFAVAVLVFSSTIFITHIFDYAILNYYSFCFRSILVYCVYPIHHLSFLLVFLQLTEFSAYLTFIIWSRCKKENSTPVLFSDNSANFCEVIVFCCSDTVISSLPVYSVVLSISLFFSTWLTFILDTSSGSTSSLSARIVGPRYTVFRISPSRDILLNSVKFSPLI